LACPLTRTPGIKSFIRFRQRRRVLLPQPDGPMSAATRCAGKFIVTSLIACLWPYHRLRFRRVNTAGSGGSMMGLAPGCVSGVRLSPVLTSGMRTSTSLGEVTLDSLISVPSMPGPFLLPPEPLADDGRYQVQCQHRRHQQDNRSRGVLADRLLRTDGPVVYLDGNGGEVIEQAGVVEGDEGECTDHYQGGRLADGAGHGEDDAGHYARHRAGQHVVPHRLPVAGGGGGGPGCGGRRRA